MIHTNVSDVPIYHTGTDCWTQSSKYRYDCQWRKWSHTFQWKEYTNKFKNFEKNKSMTRMMIVSLLLFQLQPRFNMQHMTRTWRSTLPWLILLLWAPPGLDIFFYIITWKEHIVWHHHRDSSRAESESFCCGHSLHITDDEIWHYTRSMVWYIYYDIYTYPTYIYTYHVSTRFLFNRPLQHRPPGRNISPDPPHSSSTHDNKFSLIKLFRNLTCHTTHDYIYTYDDHYDRFLFHCVLKSTREEEEEGIWKKSQLKLSRELEPHRVCASPILA